MIDRRAVLLSGLGITAASVLPFKAMAADLQKAKIGIGFKAMGSGVINMFAGQELGFTKQNGIVIEEALLGGGPQVMLALDKGAADIGAMNPGVVLPLFAKGEMPPLISFYEYTYPYKYDIVVKPDSPIKSYTDLRGKKIGVSRLSSSEYPLTRIIFQKMGWDPDKDVSWVAVGEDVTPGIALERGNIDALSYYDTGFGVIENAGIKLRYLPRPDDLPMIGGLFLSARKDYVEKHRDICVAYARSVAMTSEYLMANPAAGARAFLKMYPGAAPRDASPEEAVKQTVVAIGKRIKLFAPPYPGAKMGQMRESEWQDEAKFASLDIKDVKPVFTNDLIDEINDYDHAKVIAMAKSAT